MIYRFFWWKIRNFDHFWKFKIGGKIENKAPALIWTWNRKNGSSWIWHPKITKITENFAKFSSKIWEYFSESWIFFFFSRISGNLLFFTTFFGPKSPKISQNFSKIDLWVSICEKFSFFGQYFEIFWSNFSLFSSILDQNQRKFRDFFWKYSPIHIACESFRFLIYFSESLETFWWMILRDLKFRFWTSRVWSELDCRSSFFLEKWFFYKSIS